jgi:hypothetical protein
MSRQAMIDAIQKFAEDEKFREDVRSRRADAVLEAGYDLTKEEQEEINSLPWETSSDRDLIDRIGTVECHA